MSGALTVALVSEVFADDPTGERLAERLREAGARGAELAVLPELPLDPWHPARRTPRDVDAEETGGARHRALAHAARAAGVGVVGGAIVRQPGSGRRTNRALVFEPGGELVAAYDKLHVPCEEGYWESDHYASGEAPPQRIDAFGLPLGVQICSDLWRPEGCHLLGAAGAAAILAPRATPAASYPRWRLVMQADALTSGAYLVSVNRPAEPGAEIGGPSVVVGPDGAVLLETAERLAVCRLDGAQVEAARSEYPGYLAVQGGVYAAGWGALAGS